ncbi:hypothetical protein FQN54_008182 [Arachnomyces sp. PD_36]|nr:hypothetical protein FQN54_008182 [Arachnomyces sp. PD_36]
MEQTQLTDLAFTTRGYAIPDLRRGRPLHETINANSKSKSPIYTVIGDGLASSIFRSDLEPADDEKGEPGPGQAKYLIVGYAPQEQLPGLSRRAGRRQQIVGVKSPEKLQEWDPEHPPILVVTEMDTESNSVNHYGLLRSGPGDSKFCTPYVIGGVNVFYRHEFRVNCTAVRDCEKKWPQQITAYRKKESHIQTGAHNPGGELSDKKTKAEMAIKLDPEISISNEAMCLVKGFEASGDKWCLEELRFVPATIDRDLLFRPAHHAIHAFVESKQPITHETSALVCEAMREMWPEIPATPEVIISLKRGLIVKNIALEYRTLRAFLAEGTYRLSWMAIDSDDALGELAEEVVDIARRIVPLVPTTPISTEEEGALMVAVHNKLKEIQRFGKEYIAALKCTCGKCVSTDLAKDIWDEYADSCDIDAARSAFMAVARFYIMALVKKHEGVQGLIDRLVELLDRIVG